MVDDKGHPKDIVEQIRAVFSLLWGNQTDEFEKQILQALNASDLREYLRSPKGFFDHHIRGYSKGQRKAPIYWLLQSDRQGYSVMIYYHRYGREILHRVLGDYVKPKIRFEERRFQEIQQKIVAAEGNGEAREARDLSRILEKQEGLLEELRRFQLEIARITDLNVVPDLDDGVILNLATCHQITPWMESKELWNDLVAGKHSWSKISQNLRAEGHTTVMSASLNIQPVRSYLEEKLRDRLRRDGVIVWYDRELAFKDVARTLDLGDIVFVEYNGSYYSLRTPSSCDSP